MTTKTEGGPTLSRALKEGALVGALLGAIVPATLFVGQPLSGVMAIAVACALLGGSLGAAIASATAVVLVKTQRMGRVKRRLLRASALGPCVILLVAGLLAVLIVRGFLENTPLIIVCAVMSLAGTIVYLWRVAVFMRKLTGFEQCS